MTDDTTTATRPVIQVRVETALWDPARGWPEAVRHVASRFARVRTMDADTLLASGDLATQVRWLLEWAGTDIDVNRELGRYFDEHLPVHVRPDGATNQRIRSLAKDVEIEAVSALPPAPLESLLRHLGVFRNLAGTHALAYSLPSWSTAVDDLDSI